MRFVIVGYGRVGRRTAQVLQQEAHDVAVVEVDAEKADRAREAGFRVVNGDGGREAILRDAGIEEATALGGLTGDPNVNYAACILADEFGCRTVMRISEDYRREIYKEYAAAVDEIVYPERFGAAGAKTALLGGNFNAIADLTEELHLLTVQIPGDASVAGRDISDVDLGSAARIYAHGSGHQPMTIPLPHTTIEPSDRLAIIADRNGHESIKDTLLGDTTGERPDATDK